MGIWRANLGWICLWLSAVSGAMFSGCKSGLGDNELAHDGGREIRIWPPEKGKGSGAEGAAVAQVGDEADAPARAEGTSSTDSSAEQLSPSQRPAPGPRLAGFQAPPTSAGAQATADGPAPHETPPANLTPELRSLYEKQLAAMRNYAEHDGPRAESSPESGRGSENANTAAAPTGKHEPGETAGETGTEPATEKDPPLANVSRNELERLPPVKASGDAKTAVATFSTGEEGGRDAGKVDQASTAGGEEPSPTRPAGYDSNQEAEPGTAARDGEKLVADAEEAEGAAEPEEATPDWQELLEQTLAAMDAAIPESEDPEAAQAIQIRRRLLLLAADRHGEAVVPIETLSRDEREFWKEHLHGLSILLGSQGIPVPSRRNKEALRALRVAERHLAAASTVEVRDLAFCSRVESYGRFEAFEENAFRPSQEVLLYAAVDNFATVEEGPDFVTELQGSYQIVDGSGRRYADYDFLVDRQLCRDRRRDYFVPYRLYMPKDIAPGEYQLILTVEDKIGGKFGQNSIHFRITE